MNKKDTSYTVITSDNSIGNELEIIFTIYSKNKLVQKGSHFFYIGEKPMDYNHINFFDFCCGISNDTNYLKDIALKRSNESDFFFGEKSINIKEEYDKEKDRLSLINLVQENDFEKATILIDNYFKIFNKDRIEKKDWEDFVKYFSLNKIAPIINNVIEIGNDAIEHDGERNYKDFLENEHINIDIKKYRKELNRSDLKAKKIYECNNSKELFSVVVNSLFVNHPNKVIKKCKLCGKLFIPDRSDTLCCTRKSEKYENKSCQDAYEILSKIERRKEDECIGLRTKIYNR